MQLKNLVKQYASVKEEINEAKRKAGIDEREDHLESLINQIKDIARSVSDEEIESANTQKIRIVVSRPFKKWYDLEAIRKFAKKSELTIVEKEALKVEVDSAKFEELVKSGLISREVRQKSFREEAQTPRVMISEVKPQ